MIESCMLAAVLPGVFEKEQDLPFPAEVKQDMYDAM